MSHPDWTQALTKYLKDQLQKIQDYYAETGGTPVTPFLLAPTPNTSKVDLDLAMKNWTYCTRFANHMYEVRLLVCHSLGLQF